MAFNIPKPTFMTQANNKNYQPPQGPQYAPPAQANPMASSGGEPSQPNPLMGNMMQMAMMKQMMQPQGQPPAPQPGSRADPIYWNDGTETSGGINWNTQAPPRVPPPAPPMDPGMSAGGMMGMLSKGGGGPNDLWPSWLTGLFQ